MFTDLLAKPQMRPAAGIYSRSVTSSQHPGSVATTTATSTATTTARTTTAASPTTDDDVTTTTRVKLNRPTRPVVRRCLYYCSLIYIAVLAYNYYVISSQRLT